ncbi:hypothetical protein SLE2022_145280 [Rubroshorea leprosula]
MKTFAIFIIFSFILLVLSHARKGHRGYWESILDGEPIPDSIKELFRQDQSSLDGDDHSTQMKMDRFIRNFDVSPNLIIYHVAHGERNEDHKFHVEVKEQDIKPNMPVY